MTTPNKYYTVRGIKFSEAKSGLQKSIRRGLLDEALAYAVDMDSYPPGIQKANRTNLINRLKIIAVEDCFYPEIIPTLTEWFLKWHSSRETASSRRYLVSIVKALCEAPKLRLLSDYKLFVQPEEYRSHLGTKYDSVIVSKKYSASKIRGLDHTDKFVSFGSEYDSFLEQTFQTFPKTNKEKWLYSLASFVYSRHTFGEPIELKLQSQKAADCVYDSVGTPPYKCGWLSPKIVCDVHTGAPKTAENLYRFAIEGAKVFNEREEYFDEKLRKIYIENKVNSDKNLTVPQLDKKPEEENFLQNPLYAQKVTSGYKPFTFVTREKIYKGPMDSTKADKIISLANKFAELGDSSVLIPEKIKVEGDYYISYENVGLDWNPKVEYTVVKTTPEGQIMGNIVDRKSIGVYQGSELIENGSMDYDLLFWHFCVRYILGRGDSGLWNYINNHGIDFDDARTKFGQPTIMELLFTKKQRQHSVLEKEIASRSSVLIKKLRKLELDGDDSDRRDELVNALSMSSTSNDRAEKDLGKPVPGVPGLFIKLDFIDKKEETILMDDLKEREWNNELARRTMHFGKTYQYGSKKLGSAPKIPKEWKWLIDRISPLMDGKIDQIILNEYLPGQGIGQHTDSPQFGPIIASLSTGSGCKMDFTYGNKSVSVHLPPRSIVLLTGDARSKWKHSIAPRKTDEISGKKVARGTRISYTFRSVL